mgnify:CR=1 FL=1
MLTRSSATFLVFSPAAAICDRPIGKKNLPHTHAQHNSQHVRLRIFQCAAKARRRWLERIPQQRRALQHQGHWHQRRLLHGYDLERIENLAMNVLPVVMTSNEGSRSCRRRLSLPHASRSTTRRSPTPTPTHTTQLATCPTMDLPMCSESQKTLARESTSPKPTRSDEAHDSQHLTSYIARSSPPRRSVTETTISQDAPHWPGWLANFVETMKSL